MTITAEQYEQATGHKPIQDDLERSNCKQAGSMGHWQCGWDTEHNLPRFMTGNYAPQVTDIPMSKTDPIADSEGYPRYK